MHLLDATHDATRCPVRQQAPLDFDAIPSPSGNETEKSENARYDGHDPCDSEDHEHGQNDEKRAESSELPSGRIHRIRNKVFNKGNIGEPRNDRKTDKEVKNRAAVGDAMQKQLGRAYSVTWRQA
jgi:hypothetical protein